MNEQLPLRCRTALERLRRWPGLGRATSVCLLDRDGAAALEQLRIEASVLERFLAQRLPGHPLPVEFGARGYATLASCRILTRPASLRQLAELHRGAEDAVTSRARTDGCSHAFLRFVCTPSTSEHGLAGCEPANASEQILCDVLAALVCADRSDLGAIFARTAPALAADLERQPWIRPADDFLNVRLLATLVIGCERGAVDASALSSLSPSPYLPVWLVAEAVSGSTPERSPSDDDCQQ